MEEDDDTNNNNVQEPTSSKSYATKSNNNNFSKSNNNAKESYASVTKGKKIVSKVVSTTNNADSHNYLTAEEINKFNIGPKVTPPIREKLLSVLENNKNAFAWSDADLTGIKDEKGNIIKA